MLTWGKDGKVVKKIAKIFMDGPLLRGGGGGGVYFHYFGMGQLWAFFKRA